MGVRSAGQPVSTLLVTRYSLLVTLRRSMTRSCDFMCGRSAGQPACAVTPCLTREGHVAGERLLNTTPLLNTTLRCTMARPREFMCGRSAGQPACAVAPFITWNSHVAGERQLNTTLRRNMARSRELMCGRSSELSAPGYSIDCSCSSLVDSIDSCDEIPVTLRAARTPSPLGNVPAILRGAGTPSPLGNEEMQDLGWHKVVPRRIAKQLKKQRKYKESIIENVDMILDHMSGGTHVNCGEASYSSRQCENINEYDRTSTTKKKVEEYDEYHKDIIKKLGYDIRAYGGQAIESVERGTQRRR